MTGLRRAMDRRRDESGYTLVELMVTSTVLVVLLGMVFISITMVESLSTSVSSQYQEFQQALPAMKPFHSLVAAEVEPAPPVSAVPTPGFASIGNFSMIFYANIGTAFNNTTSCPSGNCANGGTPAGPAMIWALEVGPDGSTAPTACSAALPCSFQMRMYPPLTGLTAPGVSSCPGVGTGPVCQYSPTNYRLLANVQNVVNDPSSVDGNGVQNNPLFRYSILDPGATYPPPSGTLYPVQAITLTSAEVQSQQLTGLVGYPVNTQTISTPPLVPNPAGLSVPTLTCAAPSANYPTLAIACPADAIQSVTVDLLVAKPGTGTNGAQEDSLVVYRYAQSPGSTTAPYQYTPTVG